MSRCAQQKSILLGGNHVVMQNSRDIEELRQMGLNMVVNTYYLDMPCDAIWAMCPLYTQEITANAIRRFSPLYFNDTQQAYGS